MKKFSLGPLKSTSISWSHLSSLIASSIQMNSGATSSGCSNVIASTATQTSFIVMSNKGKHCHIHNCCAESILFSMILNRKFKLPSKWSRCEPSDRKHGGHRAATQLRIVWKDSSQSRGKSTPVLFQTRPRAPLFARWTGPPKCLLEIRCRSLRRRAASVRNSRRRF